MRGRGTKATGGLLLGAMAALALLGACGNKSGYVIVKILEPSADVASLVGIPVSIEYVDRDGFGDNDTTTTLVAVPVAGGPEIVIAADRPSQDGEVQTVAWVTAGVPEGSYRIRARTTDGLSERGSNAPGLVTLYSFSFDLVEPTGNVSISRGGFVVVAFSADLPGTGATFSVYADADGDLDTTGDRYPVAEDVADPAGAEVRFVWDSAGVPTGTWPLVARIGLPAGIPVDLPVGVTVTISDVASARKLATAGADLGRDVASFTDGTFVLAGSWDEPLPGGRAFAAGYPAAGTRSWLSDALEDGSVLGRAGTFSDGSCLLRGESALGATFGTGGGNPVTVPAGELLVRFGPDGALESAGPPPLPAGAELASFATVADGTFLLAGTFSGSAVFGAGEAKETTLDSSGARDVFLARFDAAGNLLWARSAGGAGEDTVWRLAALGNGTALLLGDFGGPTAVFGAGEAGERTLTAASPPSSFAAWYEESGLLRDAVGGPHPAGLDDGDAGLFEDGSFVVVAWHQGDFLFGEGTAAETPFSSPGGASFVARYDSDGAFSWLRTAGGTGGFLVSRLAVFRDGSAVLVGEAGDDTLLGQGETTEATLPAGGFRARYRNDGDLAFAFPMEAFGLSPLSVGGFPDGSFVVGGDFNGSVTFGAGGANETTLAPDTADPDDYDAFAAVFNADGGF